MSLLISKVLQLHKHIGSFKKRICWLSSVQCPVSSVLSDAENKIIHNTVFKKCMSYIYVAFPTCQNCVEQVSRFVMGQLYALHWTFEAAHPHFDPGIDAHHSHWQKVFRYSTSVTRPAGKNCPTFVLHEKCFFCPMCILHCFQQTHRMGDQTLTPIALNFEPRVCHNWAKSSGYTRKALGDKVVHFKI